MDQACDGHLTRLEEALRACRGGSFGIDLAKMMTLPVRLLRGRVHHAFRETCTQLHLAGRWPLRGSAEHIRAVTAIVEDPMCLVTRLEVTCRTTAHSCSDSDRLAVFHLFRAALGALHMESVDFSRSAPGMVPSVADMRMYARAAAASHVPHVGMPSHAAYRKAAHMECASRLWPVVMANSHLRSFNPGFLDMVPDEDPQMMRAVHANTTLVSMRGRRRRWLVALMRHPPHVRDSWNAREVIDEGIRKGCLFSLYRDVLGVVAEFLPRRPPDCTVSPPPPRG
jgi:hypothetical protein